MQGDQGRALGAAGHERVVGKYSWAQGTADIVQLAEQIAGSRV